MRHDGSINIVILIGNMDYTVCVKCKKVFPEDYCIFGICIDCYKNSKKSKL